MLCHQGIGRFNTKYENNVYLSIRSLSKITGFEIGKSSNCY